MNDHHQFVCHVRKLLQEFPFVRDLDALVQSQIADIVSHSTRQQGEILFNQDDPPEDCYIVLSGEVEVWQKKDRHLDPPPEVPPVHEGNANVRRHAEVLMSLLPEVGSPKPESATKLAQSGQSESQGDEKLALCHMVTLGPGMMFGEVGLLEDSGRNATVKCHSKCDFLVIQKPDFDRVLKKAMNQLRIRMMEAPMRQFLKEFDVFKQMEQDVLMRLPSALKHMHWREGSVFFREGDPPGSMYIILAGEVCVWRTGLTEGTTAAAPQAPKSLQKKCAVVHQKLHENEEYTHHAVWVEADESLDARKLGVKVAQLGPGLIFGELALVEDTPRSATVTCTKDCEVLCIAKDDFDEMLKKKMREDQVGLPALLGPLIEKVPFFEKLSPAVKENVCFAMKHKSVQAGEVLFWEGDPPGCCYFILEGSVVVWKRSGESSITEKEHVYAARKLEPLLGDPLLCAHCEDLVREIVTMDHHRCATAEMKERAKSIKRSRTSVIQRRQSVISDVMGLQVGILGQGMIFGDQALLDDKPRSATISCEKDMHLLAISREDFDRIVKQDLVRARMRQLSSKVQGLLKEFTIFSELAPSVQMDLSEVVHYTTQKAGQVVFEQGDVPKYCYILLSGEVTVWVADKDDVAEPHSTCSDSAALAAFRSQRHERNRPALESTSGTARDKCATLTEMLVKVAGHGMSTIKGSQAVLEDSCIQASSSPVAALGPGSIFGELALMNDATRKATISCYSHCDFLVIEREDFDRILKAEMKRVKDQKIAFLREFVPGAKTFSEKQWPQVAERILFYFNKVTVPRHHVFYEQGDVMDGSMYFIWQGSAESYARDPSTGSSTRSCIMLRGSLFAALPQGHHASLTTIATSATCEVLQVKIEAKKHFPENILNALREVLEQTMDRRAQQCFPLSPIGSSFAANQKPRCFTGSPEGKRPLPLPRSHKMPHPMSGRIPRPLVGRQPRLSGAGMPRSYSTPSFSGLFERVCTEIDYEAFDLEPGETIAMMAKRPKPRKKDRQIGESPSLPAIH